MQRYLPFLMWLLVSPVLAAESPDARRTNLTPHPFRTGPQESYFLSLPNGTVMRHMEVDLVLSETFRGAAFVVLDPNTGLVKRQLLGPQQRTDLRLSIGIDNRFELSLSLPFIHEQENSYVGFGLGDTPSGNGIADLVTRGTWQHLHHNDSHVNLGTTLEVTLPTGNASAYTSRDAVLLDVRESVSKPYGPFLFGGSIGVHYQPERRVVNQQDGTRIRVGLGSEYLVQSQLADHRFKMEVDTYAPVTNVEQTQFGAILGLGYELALYENWQFGTALHSALTESFGLPAYQALFSLGYRHIQQRRPARCIDHNSYRFDERCDPPDTDNDGVFDPSDKCVTEPEDKDGFEDDDGCPDPDNDQDGLLDPADGCPNEPEDVDGFKDGDGCPDKDNDNDGLLDADDQCPNEAETKNGFEDEDGCPEPDDDKDGVPNAHDRCPAEPEDKDGFEDKDGCPDPDNDGDGILDPKDLCPNEPENKNGVRDDDGCPDEILAVKTDKEIVITDEIHFKHGQVIPLKESRDILAAVAEILKKHPSLYVRIEGHTDDYGGERFNRFLSQARAQAVLDAVVRIGGRKWNLGARLTAVGFGKDKPVASNKTKEGRATNRRVIFRIMSQ